MDKEKKPQEKEARKPHDPFFRWLFSDVNHLRLLLELAGKVNVDVADFLAAVKLEPVGVARKGLSQVFSRHGVAVPLCVREHVRHPGQRLSRLRRCDDRPWNCGDGTCLRQGCLP